MTASPVRLVVLDMAGTTVDEGQHVYRVLAETAVAHGATPSEADIARWHGAAKHEALRALLTPDGGTPPSDEVLASVVEDFRGRLAAAYEAHPPRPLPGIPDAVAQLRAHGVKVVLTTGFDHEIVTPLVRSLGWDSGVVDGVVCGSDVPAGRPAPYMIFRAMELTGVVDVSAVLTAGDTPRDLEAGSNAGAGTVVGVLSGASDAVELGRSRHTHILASVAELPELLGLPAPALVGHDRHGPAVHHTRARVARR